MWKEGFPEPFQGFLSSIVEHLLQLSSLDFTGDQRGKLKMTLLIFLWDVQLIQNLMTAQLYDM